MFGHLRQIPETKEKEYSPTTVQSKEKKLQDMLTRVWDPKLNFQIHTRTWD